MKQALFELAKEELKEDLTKPVKRKPKREIKTLTVSTEGFFGFFKKKEPEKDYNMAEYASELSKRESFDMSLPVYFENADHLVKFLDVIIHDIYPHLHKEIQRYQKGFDFVKHVGKNIVNPDSIQNLYDSVKVDPSKFKNGKLSFKEELSITYVNFYVKEPSINQLMHSVTMRDDVENLQEYFKIERQEATKIAPLYTVADIVPSMYWFTNPFITKERRKVTVNKSDHAFNHILDRIKKIVDLSTKLELDVEHLQKEAIKADKVIQDKEYGDGDEYGFYSRIIIHSNDIFYDMSQGIKDDIREILM